MRLFVTDIVVGPRDSCTRLGPHCTVKNPKGLTAQNPKSKMSRDELWQRPKSCRVTAELTLTDLLLWKTQHFFLCAKMQVCAQVFVLNRAPRVIPRAGTLQPCPSVPAQPFPCPGCTAVGFGYAKDVQTVLEKCTEQALRARPEFSRLCPVLGRGFQPLSVPALLL